MHRSKQTALWLPLCEREESRNSKGCILSILLQIIMIKLIIIDPIQLSNSAIGELQRENKEGFVYSCQFDQQPRLKLNLLYLSTMRPSRLINLVYATTKTSFTPLEWNSASRLWTTSKQIYAYTTSTIKYSFSEALPKEEAKDFSDFITDRAVLEKLQKNGITKMFPVQYESFKFIEAGFDILASDRTGSGKTLGYTLPVLEKFNKAKYNLAAVKNPKFLILCPTRELVLQVTNEINKINTAYKVVAVYGGSSIERQIGEINRGVAIVVATPGRLIDLLGRQAVNMKELEVVCIDEADTMLEKGFKDDVEEIYRFIRSAAGKTQNIMFSATIPSWVSQIAREYFDKNMKRINMIKDEAVRTSETVEHFALHVKRSERHKTVQNLIEKYNPNSRTIIFTQMKAEANDFMKEFDSSEIVILHGDIPQSNRESNMHLFRNGKKKILIATDIAARGIDIPDVELIIQLSPPENPEQYIHRSGRTGRAGKAGTNITFFDGGNIEDLIAIEKAANISIKLISDNHNISFWKNKLKAIVHKVNDYAPSKSEEVYKKFIEDILKKNTAEKAMLYFLKDALGELPETTSILTNQKGLISYIAYTNQAGKAKLSDVFEGIKIENEIVDKQGIKFDIPASQFYQFEDRVQKQQDFEIQPLDENATLTLSLFAKKIRRTGHSNERYDGQRSYGRQDRRGHDRNGGQERYGQRQEQYGQRQRNGEQQRHGGERRRQAPQNIDLPEGLSNYKVFLFGFSAEFDETNMKEEIKEQANLQDFKLKILKKVDVETGASKTFGFIQFSARQDCRTFLDSQISLKGSLLKKRLAEDRK